MTRTGGWGRLYTKRGDGGMQEIKPDKQVGDHGYLSDNNGTDSAH